MLGLRGMGSVRVEMFNGVIPHVDRSTCDVGVGGIEKIVFGVADPPVDNPSSNRGESEQMMVS